MTPAGRISGPTSVLLPHGEPGCGRSGGMVASTGVVPVGLNPIRRQVLTSSPPQSYGFWAKVDAHWFFTASEEECWLWLGAVNSRGYGTVKWRGVSRLVHRLAYEMAFGSIAGRHHVHHRCEQPLCVNPRHLAVLTPAEHNRLHKLKKRGPGRGRRPGASEPQPTPHGCGHK